MSEQIELDGINLCIPEDTFEKFQANSLYEVKECITLSNSVSEAPASERGEDNIVTCSDDVVTLNSGNEKNTDCHNEPDHPHKAGTAETLNNSTVTPLPSGSIDASDNKFIHGKKRGRKKKTALKSSEQLSVSTSDSDTILDYTNEPSESIEDIQHFIQNTNPTSTSNRRGRPPKSNTSEDLSPSKRRLSKESVIDTAKESSVVQENQVPKKRGRPRKSYESLSINNVSSTQDDESALFDSIQHQDSKDNTDRPQKIQKKRGRPSKILSEEKCHVIEIIDKIDETKPSASLPDVSKGFTQKKTTVKKGRPKKGENSVKKDLRKNKNNELQMSPDNVFLEENEGDENDDDMSLSKISKIVHKNFDAEKAESDKELENNTNSQKKETLNIIEVREKALKTHTEETPLEMERAETNNHATGSDIDIDHSRYESLNVLKGSSDPKKIVEEVNNINDTEAIEQPLENESSKLTEVNNEQLPTPQKRNSKVPIMSDFEYNLDNIDNENLQNKKGNTPINDPCFLLVEDVSKRPTRNKSRQTIQYHDESDEDPFANIELSDDEPIMRRKGKRYNSDDEYFPVAKRDSSRTMSSDSESNNDENSDKKHRKRKYSKKSDSQSPRKRGRKSNLEKATVIDKSLDIRHELTNDDDSIKNIEDCIQLSDIKSINDTSKDFDCRTEIETLLAKKIQGTNLKIKKVSSAENADTITPLKIPTIDPSERKKVTDTHTQTNKIVTNNVDTQTEGLYDISMKDNVTLTAEQSEKACEFLTNIVTTTAELGKLLTQKSDDFMKKKINTEHVVDTVKMDYCVKKSFLLFKLAKHNLTQMEEDLATQYEDFLSKHDLLKYREQPKKISPTVKDSDSDCEIIEESVEVKQPEKSVPKFNPKTVFLNKELSIKIAKKPSEDKNLSIKGKHTVWINDSVMVKKVKPTQSFLAQDSRNKKPPDQNFITTKMVSDFFEDYYRKQTLATCSLYASPKWLHLNHNNYVCHYFVVNTDFSTHVNFNQTEDYHLNSAHGNTSTANNNQNLNTVKNNFHVFETLGPETLLTLCTEVLQKHLTASETQINGYSSKSIHKLTTKKNGVKLKSLLELCIQVFSHEMKVYQAKRSCERDMHHTVLTLKTLCYLKVLKLLLNSTPSKVILTKSKSDSEGNMVAKNNNHSNDNRNIKTLFAHCVDCICRAIKEPSEKVTYPLVKKNDREIKSLSCLCIEYFQNKMSYSDSYSVYPMIKSHKIGVKSLITLCVNSINVTNKKILDYVIHSEPKRCKETKKPLSSPCVESMQHGNTYSDKCILKTETKNYRKPVKSLFSLCAESFLQINAYSNKCIVNSERKCNWKPVKSLLSLCVESFQQKNAYSNKCIVNSERKCNWKPVKSLLSLCVESFQQKNAFSNKCIVKTETEYYQKPIKSLLSPCFECARPGNSYQDQCDVNKATKKCRKTVKSLVSFCIDSINFGNKNIFNSTTKRHQRSVKSLFSICLEYIQRTHESSSNDTEVSSVQFAPKSLKDISLKNIIDLLYNNSNQVIASNNVSVTDKTLFVNSELADAFTINSVNTLSEEAFHNLQNTVEDDYYDDYDDDHSYLNNEEFESTFGSTQDHNSIDDKNWISQVRMKEFQSYANINSPPETGVTDTKGLIQDLGVAIKCEPVDYSSENILDSVSVKIEPMHELDEMTMIPEIVMTKSETVLSQNTIEGQQDTVNDSSAFSVDTFEDFFRKNKLIPADNEGTSNEIYSQSSLRVRQQHEPDYVGEHDIHDGLLIPHTYANIISAKNSLMANTSNEANLSQNNAKKKPGKRKIKSKKTITKLPNKDIPLPSNDNLTSNSSEVDGLTRRMKYRIREEKKNARESFKSDNEDFPLSVIKGDEIKNYHNKKRVSQNPDNDAIQCSEVDSTEKLNSTQEETDSPLSNTANLIDPSNNETNMSDESNNESCSDSTSNNNDSLKKKSEKKPDSLRDLSGPKERIECEPTISDYIGQDLDSVSGLNEEPTLDKDKDDKKLKEGSIEVKFRERFGWSCYAVNTKDPKLHQETVVLLDKLPESFVKTYFQYQQIGGKDEVDMEIDRLTNVKSLNRTSKKQIRKLQKKLTSNEANKKKQPKSSSVFEDSNGFDKSSSSHELSPSDDEEINPENETPSVNPMRHAENYIAKDSLMNDESETEEISTDGVKQEPVNDAPRPKRPGPKSKTKENEEKILDNELILTADKMMKEELTLLHAPPTLSDVVVETTTKEDGIKTRRKSPRKVKHEIKCDEDSSSEEEKQWVTRKEKLLKKMKHQKQASICDAKRAKMVSEFIEKRGVGSESRKVRGKHRGSRKKLLEREKQLNVLSRELYGESSTNATHPRKSYFSSNFNGRRNIRKVIDKKSLKQSTVKAIMEEFERKRRLNEKQNKLREHLGCDENVNVLVINDEVCLEYDFEEDRPIVTVHQFFTKVMKAHQCEGVKFMWDACFESVSRVRAGQAGAGCILAHCMGLGKTLQVLALLHTVLTHPGVGIKRVLVCCPLSTVLNWVDEIHKWIGPVTDEIKVFELSKLKKTYERAYQLEDWYTGGGIFIIGYELFRSLTTLDPALDDVRPTIVRKIRTALLDPGPDVVVCDEGHLLKNDCSVLAVAMSRVATRRRIVLTGTPMQNNLREYYCMVNFIKPNLLGSYAEYSNRFANPIMNGQHRDSSEEDIKLMKTRTHILHKVLEGCLQRHEASVLYPYLPKKHEYTVFIPLTKCQWDLYKHYMYTYCSQNKQSILKDFHTLQKIWTHPQVLHNFNTQLCRYKKPKDEKLEDELAQEDLAADDIKPSDTETWWLQYLAEGSMDSLESSNKFVAVFRILHECIQLGDKVLIFSTSLFCLDTLEFFLKKMNNWSLGQEYYRLDGSVPPEVRHKWCREFNAEINEKTKVFLISTRAGCLGLNMTAANRVIILDTSWNPAHDIQSIFRVYRFGQKKDCFIYRLVAMGTMEQKIYERSVTKQAVACRVVDEQQIDRHYNSADLAELYRLDELGGSVAGGVAAGVRDVVLLRVARDGPVHAVHEHDSLLRASEPALPEHERAAAWHQFQLERAAEQNDNKPTVKKTKVTTKSVKDKSNNETETTAQEPGTSKAKKEDSNTNTEAETQNSSSTPENVYQNEIIEKVVNILFKHNYPNLDDVKEMTNVVNIVQHITSRVPVNEENKDHVVAVITENLLQHLVMRRKAAEMACENNGEGNKSTEIAKEQSQKSALPQKKSERLKEKEMLLRKRKEFKETNNCEQYDKNDGKTYQAPKNVMPAQDLHNNGNKEKKIRVTDEHDIPTRSKDFDTPVKKVKKRRKVFSKESELHKVLEQNSSLLSELLRTDEPRKAYKVFAGDVKTTNRDSYVNEVFAEDVKTTNRDSYANHTKQMRTDTISKQEVPTVSQDLSPSSYKQKKTDKAIPKVTLDLKFSSNKNKKTNIKSSEKEDAIVIEDVSVEEHKTNQVPRSNNLPTTELGKENLTSKSMKSSSEAYKGRERKNKKKESNGQLPVATETSILLSDDDDVSVVQTTSFVPAATDNSGVKSCKNITKPDETNDESVPLHPSLLSNKHFIALVAHTYLEGNPTLDADAATLAAQYSTLKAKKELEQTGRSIISGPLYDIAVKVVGYEILRRLHKASNSKPSTKTVVEVEAALRLEESACDLVKTSQCLRQKSIAATTVPPVPPVPPAHSRPPKTTNVTSGEKLTVTHTPESTSKVVPVELFKGPSIPGSRSTRQNREECILPDDDAEMTIKNKPERGPITSTITTTTPTNTMAAKSLHTKPIVLQRFNIKPLPTTSVNVTKTTGNSGSTIVNTSEKSPPISKNTIVTGKNELTICLDSDDEQTPETTAALSPVPVALTSVNIQPMPITKVTASPSRFTSQTTKCVTAVKSADKTTGLSQAKPLILAIRNRQLANAAETSKQVTSPPKNVADGSNKITLLYTADKNKRAIKRRPSSKPEEAPLASEAKATPSCSKSLKFVTIMKPTVKSKEELTISYGSKRSIAAVSDDGTSNNEKNKTKLKVDKKSNNAKSSSLSLKFMPMIDLTSNGSSSSKKMKLDDSNYVDLCSSVRQADVMKDAKSPKGQASTKKSSDMPQTSSSEKKRRSTFDIKPPKKKKPENMSLQDFNIEDLEDIIELE